MVRGLVPRIFIMDDKRLNKTIAETGYCSRRMADKLIEAGKVLVNDVKADLGVRVSAKDKITVEGKVITKQVKDIYLIFNKPIGVTCTTDLEVKGNITAFMNYPERIFPIGRLDKPSEGLLFLTNDGDIVNKILRAGNNHEKEYIVTVNNRITKLFIAGMGSGVPILDTLTKPCKVEKLNDYTFKIVLTQGLNRQIRRMCTHFGYKVNTLKRVRIMNIQLGDLKKGKYRNFTKEELSSLLVLIENSSKIQ